MLCLNSGISPSRKAEQAKRTSDGFEETIGVNHLGHFYLASLLTPTLATAVQPRLVVTASPVHDPTSGGGNVGAGVMSTNTGAGRKKRAWQTSGGARQRNKRDG